jgi:flagellar hook-associated protein 3 FlgL
MRVASNSFTNSLVTQLGDLTARQARLQNQVATGQRVALPSDDPVAMQRALNLQAEAGAVGQYGSNIARLQEVAGANHEVMRGLKRVLDRAGEIATLADGLKSPAELRVYAAELNELIQQAAQWANTKHRGDFLLAGTRSDAAPFVVATDPDGSVTSVTYQGNASVAEAEVAEGATLSAGVPGANSSGSGARGLLADARSGADFFAHLIALKDNLLAGDTAAIAAADRASLAADEENLLFHLGQNGAVQSRLEAAAALARNRGLSLEQSVSAEVDADLAQTLVRLSETQTAYQAALQSAGSILNVSLLDYLR